MSKYFVKKAKARVEPESGTYLVLEEGSEIDTDYCEFAAIIPRADSHDKQPIFLFKFENALLCTESVIDYLTQQGAPSYINAETSEFTILRKVEDKDITWIKVEDIENYVSWPDAEAFASSEVAVCALQGSCSENHLNKCSANFLPIAHASSVIWLKPWGYNRGRKIYPRLYPQNSMDVVVFPRMI